MKKPVARKGCPKCGKVISLNYYPLGRSIPEELEWLIDEHSLHLYESCSKVFPLCDAQKVVFGKRVGNDNIIECDGGIEKERKK